MSDKDLMDVEPINTRKVNGDTVREKYSYGGVYPQDVPEDFRQKNVDFEKGIENIRWQYSGKCPILITPDGVKAKEDAPLKEAQNQAYFALSILAEEGYVSHWEKQ